jgi:hypothetical protein
MATLNYLAGRKKYGRPQALLFADTPGTLIQGANGMTHVPDGIEINAVPDANQNERFLILSDHNRGPIDIKNNRLEQKERTINGKMRSFYIADKNTFSVSWQNLPSRSFSNLANFNNSTGAKDAGLDNYTVDGGAGGNELLDWYLNHKGSFYLFVAYDNYIKLKDQNNTYNRLGEYQEVIEVLFSDFSYSVNKRGYSKHDLWDISLSLEEI